MSLVFYTASRFVSNSMQSISLIYQNFVKIFLTYILIAVTFLHLGGIKTGTEVRYIWSLMNPQVITPSGARWGGLADPLLYYFFESMRLEKYYPKESRRPVKSMKELDACSRGHFCLLLSLWLNVNAQYLIIIYSTECFITKNIWTEHTNGVHIKLGSFILAV